MKITLENPETIKVPIAALNVGEYFIDPFGGAYYIRISATALGDIIVPGYTPGVALATGSIKVFLNSYETIPVDVLEFRIRRKLVTSANNIEGQSA